MGKRPTELCRGCGAALDAETAVRVERARCSFCLNCYLRHDVRGRPYGRERSTTPIYHVPRAVAPKPLRGGTLSSPPRTHGEQHGPPETHDDVVRVVVSWSDPPRAAGLRPMEAGDERDGWLC
jgi:hypothetical protein